MNWKDIERSLDSEFKRLDLERERQLKEDEKLADFLVRKFEEVQQDSERLEGITVTHKSTYEEMLEEDPEGMAQAEKELDEELAEIKKAGEVCSSCDGLGYHPPFTFDQDQETPIPCGKCNNHNPARITEFTCESLQWMERREDERKLVNVVKGSSANEFKQNWKEKVEAS